MKHLVLVLILLLATVATHAQNILGTVSNLFTDQPVRDAVITVRGRNLNVQSDQAGVFKITGLAPGRYVLRIQHLQFASTDVEVLIRGGRDAHVQIGLEPRIVPLAEVTVPGETTIQPDRMYRITQDEIRRYPGTFFDPARFTASFPGVSVANDQANQLVIYGLHPDLMQWRLEGLEIVNPNHLANAGTIGDRPTATGGGVNMLSNLMLSYSSLVTGPFNQQYGNAISGVMDMHLRSGNADRPEHTAQLGLLGLDVATEGPFKPGSQSSYVLNARYSTVGLLTDLGVDFGEEDITFYDIATSIVLPIGETGGRVKIFAFGGGNSNDLAPGPPEEWTEERDRKIIEYESMTGAFGAEWTQPMRASGFFRFATALSGNDHQRDEMWLDEAGAMSQYASESGETAKWSSKLTLGTTTTNGTQLSAGVESILTSRALVGTTAFGRYAFAADGNVLNLRPHVEGVFSLGRIVTGKAGLGLGYYRSNLDAGDISEQFTVIEPFASLEITPRPHHQFVIGYRRVGQMLYDLSLTGMSASTANVGLAPIQSDILHIHYHHAFPLSVIEVGAFLYRLSDVPVTTGSTDLTALNLTRLPVNVPLVSAGTATNYAFTLAYRRNFSDGYFASANASIISSLEESAAGIERSTTFDVGHALYAAAGKEWTAQRPRLNRTIGFNVALVEHGGFYTGEISQSLSLAEQRTIELAGTQGTRQLETYYRVDFRIYLRRDKMTHASTWSLDIQNVLNRKNAFLSQYDFFLNEVRPVEQLGIVPVLNYRIDF